MKKITAILTVLIFSLTVFLPTGIYAEETAEATIIPDINKSFDEHVQYWKDFAVTKGVPDADGDGIMDDPQVITDADFFGVYNDEAQNWESEPYLNYSYQNDDGELALEKVEQAAKEGDYPLAKEELLSYYRTVQYKRSEKVSAYPGIYHVYVGNNLSKNLYAISYSIGRTFSSFYVDNNSNNNWHEIDALDMTTRSKGNVQYLTLCLAPSDNKDNEVIFNSRDTSFAPYLEITVNGETKQIPACKDTYISSGANNDVNFGEATELKCQLSGSWQNHDDKQNIVMMGFDVDFIEPTDNISAATIFVNGYNSSSTGKVEMIAYHLFDGTWEEDTMTYAGFEQENDAIFSCYDSYSWDYMTATQMGSFLNGIELSKLAEMYSYTQSERYAYTFFRQEMGFVNSLSRDFEPHVTHLQISNNLIFMVPALYRTLDSDFMTGEILTAVLKRLWLWGEYNVNTIYGVRKNNWATFATQGATTLLSYFPELAAHDDWFEKTCEENERLIMTHFSRPDGTNVEISQNYQGTLIQTVTDAIDVAVATGHSIPLSEEAYERLRELMLSYYYILSPTRSGWGIGDETGQLKDCTDTLKSYHDILMYDNDEYKYIYTDGREGKLPDFTTKVWPNLRWAYMKTDWGKNAAAMVLTAKAGKGAADASHGDYDQLSIAVMANGKHLLTDQGYGTTIPGYDGDYFSESGAHNLVQVNDANASGSIDGVQLGFETNNLYDYIEYGCTAMPGTNIDQRSVTFARGQKFWIVSDYIKPTNTESVTNYDQNWHFGPGAAPLFEQESNTLSANYADGHNVLVVPVESDNMQVSFDRAYYTITTNTYVNSKKAVFTKDIAGEVKYTTVIVPENIGENFSVSATSINQGDNDNISNAATIIITDLEKNKVRKYYYFHINDESKKTEADLIKYKTDATNALIEEDEQGNLLSYSLYNATYLKNTGTNENVFTSQSEIQAVAVCKNGNYLSVNSSSLTESQLDSISFDTMGTNGVMLNEEIIKTPQDTPSDTESDNTNSDTEYHGSSGGGGGGGTPKPDKENQEEQNKEEQTENVLPEKIEIPHYAQDELKNHWGKEQITELCEKGLVTGDGSSLRLTDNISRAEFVAVIMRMLDIEASYKNIFSDVSENLWYSSYVTAASELGIISGFDGRFMPNNNITREEMCKIIVGVYEKYCDKALSSDYDFADKTDISQWADESVGKAYNSGLINGVGNNLFKPKDNALREQAFVVCARLSTAIEELRSQEYFSAEQ